MQKRNTYRQLFTKKGANIKSAMPSTPTPTNTPSSVWYQSITQLPLNRFIDCIVDNNLSALIISGFPSQLELQIAWEEIKMEYSDAMGDLESRVYHQLFKEVHGLTITLEQVQLLTDTLDKVYYEPLAKKLNGLLHTNFKFNPKEPEAYRKMLRSCINRSKAFKIDLDLKTIKLKGMAEKKEQGKGSYSRQYFQSFLITLSDHAKFPIQESVTVYEFCERIRRFNAHCEMMQKTLKR